MKNILFCLTLWTLIFPAIGRADNALSLYSELNNAGLLMVNDKKQAVISDHANKLFIPASTTKLVTAWLALKHWGEGHRFQTKFFLDKVSNTLWVKGTGDPFLVSEELQLIARNLKQSGVHKINAIGLDTSYFHPSLVLPGMGATDNPYDAAPSAIAANFNTVYVKKSHGRVVSAEVQTPLTAYAENIAKRLTKGSLRVNTGHQPRNAAKYFAELLAAFLRKQGVQVNHQIIYGQVPIQQIYYTHVNSKTLGEIIRPMMKYSTNFIANQLVLMLSADKYRRPANAADVQRYMKETLSLHFNWDNFTLQDGAGLSRDNRLSPAQLVEILYAFKPWQHLLPEIEQDIYAKSGTLIGVSTLAGYIVENKNWKPFALMMNQAVPYKLRNRIAQELSRREFRKTAPISKNLG